MEEVTQEIADIANNAPVSDNVKTIHLTEEDMQGGATEDNAPADLVLVPRKDGYDYTVAMIVAMNKRSVIGHENKLPWKLSKDLKFFKETTEGGVIIMGRKTWESIGSKPLPNRISIVVTRNLSFVPQHDNVMVAHSIESALRLAKCENRGIFFIGGAAIYEECIQFCDTLYITAVDNEVEGDTIFPCPTGPSKLGDYFKTLGFNHSTVLEEISIDEKNECAAQVLQLRKVVYPASFHEQQKFDPEMIKRLVAKMQRPAKKAVLKGEAKDKRTAQRRKQTKAKKKAQKLNRK